MELQVDKVLIWMKAINDNIQYNKAYLTSLDQAIGDGDHGINMARGFKEVVAKISTTEYVNVSDLLKDVSMTLLSKTGGASGPIYGTAFMRMSTTLKGIETINYEQFCLSLEAALEGMKQRGKANLGEKTLIDVWVPIIEYLKTRDDLDPDGLEATAKMAMEATKDMEAKKGRAAYLRERSIGHLDPGSVSSYYIFSALSDVIKKGA